MELLNLGIVQVYEDGLFRHIHPSTKVDGTWQDTDISSESSEVKEFCEAFWTDKVKTEYQAHVDTNLVEG
jgi:hypothetical protein